jgi:hypothetical protein
MTDKVSKTAFRYDHMSDIFKLCLVVFGVGIRNDDIFFWVLVSAFIFTYTYSEILSHDLANAKARINLAGANGNSSASTQTRKKSGGRFFIVRLLSERCPSCKNFLKAVYKIVFGFNGHTLLVFFALPAGGTVSMITLLYLILLVVMIVFTSINSLRHMSR